MTACSAPATTAPCFDSSVYLSPSTSEQASQIPFAVCLTEVILHSLSPMATSPHPRRSARIAAYSPNKLVFASDGQGTVSGTSLFVISPMAASRNCRTPANRAGSPRKKHASAAGSQSDTGSAGYSSSSSGSSGSSVWDSLENFKESKKPPRGPIPPFQELSQRLVSIVHLLTAKPDDLVSCSPFHGNRPALSPSPVVHHIAPPGGHRR